ncbi:unnamed protein product, partial [Musa textilis]
CRNGAVTEVCRCEIYDGVALTGLEASAFVVQLHVSAAFVFAVVMLVSVNHLRRPSQDNVKESFVRMLQRYICGFREDV